ncbi:DUF5681 domain-containing protein [Sneathiella sp.]|uniref:DUF5681 domain-containing protein n=1 Tax=Sneathiella sp. TaxID=1964365 RepID=UPI002613E003|nr:DUF5681 domain-containing protein [Sneathiella sp.]MDF2367764.1 DUF5681 domain-containing protein [Sneathiella sp.]
MSSNDTKLTSGTMPPKDGFNPGGRPKGSKNLKTMLRDIMLQEYVVTEDGKKKRLTLLQITLLNLRKAALEDASPRAMKKFLQMQENYRPDGIDENGAILLAPAEMTPEEWAAEQLEKNKTRKPPPGVYDDEEDDDPYYD